MMKQASILYIDDEALALKALKRSLRSKPYAVHTAQDPYDGLMLALSQRFDVVIIDVMMPRVLGLDLIKPIKEYRPNVPILMMTGLDDDEVLFESVGLGCDGFIEKPYDPHWLASELDAMLSQRQQMTRPWFIRKKRWESEK